MQSWQVVPASLLLLAAVLHPAPEAATSEKKWWSSRESLSDYEVVNLFKARSRVQCIATASRDSTVQLAAFNFSSGLCTHFKCRLGLSHCRKCRSVNRGLKRVWTFSSECWTTVQHRVSGSVNFYRNWTQYQSEFGEGPDGNYWIGLNALHRLTSPAPRKMRFLMKPWNGSESWAEYSSVSISTELDKYRLSVSGFSASPGIGDCFSSSNGRNFSTMDADHDGSSTNCAMSYVGAWWFSACHCTHPNGVYKDSSVAIGGAYAQGVIWRMNYGYYYSLMEFEMLLL